MKDFIFHNPTKIVFGKSSMNQIAKNAKPFGKNVLVTFGEGSAKRTGVYEKVKRQLKGFEVREFWGIEPNPRVETIRKCLKENTNFEPDLILAVGGGSVIDGSKLVAASWHYDGDPWDFLIKSPEPTKYVPLATVLTMSATASEMNDGAVISNWTEKRKLFFTRPDVFPKFSILDPRNTFTVPKNQIAYGVVDAFSHVLEQYIRITKNVPLQDRIAESILLTLIENGPLAIKSPTNYNVRATLMWSATMALNDVIRVGADEDWATHMIEHELSAFYDIPHAAGLAMITPRWMNEVREQKKQKLVQYGKRIWGLGGSDKEVVEDAIQKTYEFFESLGIKMSFKDWGINKKNLDTITKRLVKMGIGETPLSNKQITNILNSCLK